MTEFKPQFRAQLLSILMQALFVKQHEEIKKEINAIILDNSYNSSPRAFAFRYKNKAYIDEGLPNYTPKIELHVDHRATMDNILVRQQHIEMEYIRIDAYITRCMNLCKTVSDLYVTIPEQLHKFFPSTITTHKSRGNSPLILSEAEATRFARENEVAHASLMRRLLTLIII